MTPSASLPAEGRTGPPLLPFRRLEAIALVVPSLLLAALIGLDYFVLERVLPSEEGHLVMLVVGLAGVISFSLIIFARLTQLHERLAAQGARLVASEERHRIASELQDGVIQSLYGVSLVIEDAGDRLATQPEAAKRELGRAVDRLGATIEDLRARLQA